ncbi:MAG TPA: sigma-70 family RNA polymerase sigma factor [Solirubrobacterales bacterium]|jgi:RNA polymerase sigma factor (sigma-70 family)|nr:sigma-70 family RNA polymerase sigma factor [Solirubrobacterales bacterium]
MLHSETASGRQARAQIDPASGADEFVERHGQRLLSVARRFSRCAADADDAYQRALEIYLLKAPAADEDHLVPWLMTVVRNEALQIQRKSKRFVSRGFEEIADSWAADDATPEERLIDGEDLGHGRYALSRLKPDQVRCLLLRADGHRYEEIASLTGFSMAKINRCLSDGRKALRIQFGLLESGAECRRHLPTLSLIADDAIAEEACPETHLHLANCVACQATLREFCAAPRRVAAVFPAGVAFSGTLEGYFRQAIDGIQSGIASFQERFLGQVAGAPQGSEAVFAKKAIAVSAIAASLTAGGVAVERVVTPDDRDTPDARLEAPAATGATGPPALVTPIEKPSTDGDQSARDGAPREAQEAEVQQSRAESGTAEPPSQPAQEGASIPDPTDFSSPPDPPDFSTSQDAPGGFAP